MLPTNLVKLMLIMCSLLLSAYSMAQDQPPIKQHVTLKLGKQGEDCFRQSHGIKDKHTSPRDLKDFNELDWSTPPYGQVTVEHAGRKILFPYTEYAFGSFWPRFSEDGISGLDLRSGISEHEFIRHQEAWERWQALLKHFLDNGWQFYIHESLPRVSGAELYRYSMSDQTTLPVIDPRYELSYAQWQELLNERMSTTSAKFYRNGVYMSFLLIRNDSAESLFVERKLDLNPDEWGQYTISTRFDTARSIERLVVLSSLPKNDDDTETELKIRQNLPLYWQERKQRYAKEREQAEQKLVQQGYRIDTSYQEPDISPYLQSKPVC